MKKSILFLASAALILAGCAKESLKNDSLENGELTTVTFTAGLDGQNTKATIDNDGHAAKVNHWIMEVRDEQNDLFIRQEKKNVTAGTLTQTFTFDLFKGQDYTLQFWADTEGAYDTGDLTAISTADTTANVDSRDAFSANVKYTPTSHESKSVTLYRPFAQLNIITTDLQKMKAQVESEVYPKYKPKDLKLVASVPTTFNVQTQKAGKDSIVTVTADTCYADFMAAAPKTTIYMDYIFASEDTKDVVDLAFSFKSNSNPISYNFSSIPLQRNYRTNILGDFLSYATSWEVTIEPDWFGEYDKEFSQVGSFAAANEALLAGKTDINIVNPSDLGIPIAFPAASEGKNITINVYDYPTGFVRMINYPETQGPANIFINGNIQSLDLQTPNSHVELRSGDYQSVFSKTSASTLVICKDATVFNVNLEAGSLEVHGLMTQYSNPNNCKITYHIETPEVLRDVAKKIGKAPAESIFPDVFIENDIDLKNEEWTPIEATNKKFTLDGQNHTIKNIKVTESTGAYIGFFAGASQLTAKDLTLDGVTLTYPSTSGSNARAAAFIAHAYAVNLDNCHAKNVAITANQKTGGFIGYLEGDTVFPITVNNCSIEKVSIQSNVSGDYIQAGGFICHVSLSQNPLITISACSAKDVTIKDYFPGPYTSDWMQCVPHVFIGEICQNYTGAETPSITSHSVVLSNNTISGTNTDLPKCPYSSDYFGWAGNDDERPAWKGHIYIDGTKWAPAVVE